MEKIQTDLPVQCCRCKNKHNESERNHIPHKTINSATQSVCPRCSATSYYDMTPMVAYCWATGVIEFSIGEVPEGAIHIASGPKSSIKAVVSSRARHSYDGDLLLVPGVPEAKGDQRAAGDALMQWLDWCASSKRVAKQGVTFMAMKPAEKVE